MDSKSPFSAGGTEQLNKVTDVKLESESPEDIEEALSRLNQKMKAITIELAEGKINQAQFQAIYSRYREQREIIDRIKERSPKSNAWQNVARAGITTLLRSQHGADVIGLVIIHNKKVRLINTFGDIVLSKAIGAPLLASIQDTQIGVDECTQIHDGRYIQIVSGETSTTIFFYSAEPPRETLEASKKAHADFEKKNLGLLHVGKFKPEQLKYPQKDLMVEGD